MFGLFVGLKGLLKLKATTTDGPVFRLHTKFTVMILLCFSVLLSCRQYFGDPIYCIQKDVINIAALETFCWSHATYVLPEEWNSTVGEQVAHPGISNTLSGKHKTKRYHGYYQWVALTLLVQGILFYIPRYLWKCWERGTMKALILDFQDPLLPKENLSKDVKLLATSLKLHWGQYSFYFGSYMFCEILSLVNVIGQIFLLDAFLNGVFTSFGIKVLMWSDWDQEYRNDPLVEAFPRMTKCRFNEFGSSGDIQKYDALCLLPMNVLNEKIFIFLWFWMLLLCVMSLFLFLYRLLLIGMPMLRYCVIIPKAPRTHKGALDKILFNATMGDWFILYLLAKNVDPNHYSLIIGQLAAALENNGYLSVSSSSSADDVAFV